MEIEHRKLNEIRPYENNPRVNDQAVDAVARSLEQFGFRRLLDGAKVHVVNTDPPYNEKVEPGSNNAIAAGRPVRYLDRFIDKEALVRWCRGMKPSWERFLGRYAPSD